MSLFQFIIQRQDTLSKKVSAGTEEAVEKCYLLNCFPWYSACFNILARTTLLPLAKPHSFCGLCPSK